MKNEEIEAATVSESHSHLQEFGHALLSTSLGSDAPRRSRRAQGGLIGAMAMAGLLAAWVASGVKSNSLPAPTVMSTHSNASLEEAGSQDLLLAKQRIDVTEAQLARALHDEGNSSTASTPTSGEARVLALQDELVIAQTERDQRGPASEEEAAATRHHEDLLRITYEAQLATLSPTERQRVAVTLLRKEATLAGNSYQRLAAHQAKIDAQSETLKRRQTSIAEHALLSRQIAAGIFGALFAGLLGLFLSRNRNQTLAEQSGNPLSLASAGRFRLNAAIAKKVEAKSDPSSDSPVHGVIPAVAVELPGLAYAGKLAPTAGGWQKPKALFETRWRGRLGPLEAACRDAIYSILLADWGKGIRSYAVVSTYKGAGKTTVIANMAMALARAGLRVVLIDANGGEAKLHEIFFVGNGFGLLNILRGELDLDRAPTDAFVSRTWLPDVSLVTAGTTGAQPAEWVQSPLFRGLLNRLTSAFDLVLVDVPSDRSTDAINAIAKSCGGVIVLLRDGAPHVAASSLYENFANSGVYIAGTLLNHLPETAASGSKPDHANEVGLTVNQD